jgi:enoyl-CoA hydratase
MAGSVLLERDGDIATVVLNAPERLNALDGASWRALGEVLRELSGDEGLRCIVLRGAGDKAFAAGADIAEFETERANSDQARRYGAHIARVLEAIVDCRHPTVALIKGACVGGGLELASCCDMRICGASSRFGVPINRLGLVMAYPEITALVGLVGRATTLEILLEGRVFGADEAYHKGLVNRVVADDEVEAEAYATARRIADGAPLVARWHRMAARRVQDAAPPTGAEIDESFACYDSEDYRIGVRAFLAKEKPRFEGR